MQTFHDEDWIVEVLKVGVATRTADAMSSVLSGCITLKGHLVPITLPHTSRITPYYTIFFISSEIGDIEVTIFRDCSDTEFGAGKEVVLVPFKEKDGDVWSEGQYCYRGLVLESVSHISDPHQYRRLGYLEFGGKNNQGPKSIQHTCKVNTFDII